MRRDELEGVASSGKGRSGEGSSALHARRVVSKRVLCLDEMGPEVTAYFDDASDYRFAALIGCDLGGDYAVETRSASLGSLEAVVSSAPLRSMGSSQGAGDRRQDTSWGTEHATGMRASVSDSYTPTCTCKEVDDARDTRRGIYPSAAAPCRRARGVRLPRAHNNSAGSDRKARRAFAQGLREGMAPRLGADAFWLDCAPADHARPQRWRETWTRWGEDAGVIVVAWEPSPARPRLWSPSGGPPRR